MASQVDKIFAQLEPVFEEWADYVIAELITNKKRLGILDKDAVSTGELLDSLAYDLTVGNAGALGEIFIGFDESGRFSDMGFIDYGEDGPNIDALEDWIRKKGLQAFRLGKRYREELSKYGVDETINSLAWAMNRKKALEQKKRRGFRFSKVFYGTISYLRELVLDELTEAQLRMIEQMNRKVTIKM